MQAGSKHKTRRRHYDMVNFPHLTVTGDEFNHVNFCMVKIFNTFKNFAKGKLVFINLYLLNHNYFDKSEPEIFATHLIKMERGAFIDLVFIYIYGLKKRTFFPHLRTLLL